MIDIYNESALNAAVEYFESIVDDSSPLAKPLRDFTKERRDGLLSDRKFLVLDDLFHGAGQGSFSKSLLDAVEIFQGKSSSCTLLIFDSSFNVNDVNQASVDNYEEQFLPNLVQRIGKFDPSINFDRVSEAIKRCISFSPIAFVVQDYVKGKTDVNSLLVRGIFVSAFDQEGAIAWVLR